MVALPRAGLTNATEPVVLCAPVGPYASKITSLIWALHRQRGLRVTSAYLAVDRGCLDYLWSDFLDSGRALDDLRRALGEGALDHHDVHMRLVRGADGRVQNTELDPTGHQRIRDTLWNAARDAIVEAGERPVIFGLTGHYRDTTNSLLSGFFPLLAREQDRLVDVRIADARVENESEFFFPEQRQRRVRCGRSMIDTRKVGVELVDVELPRLAGVVDGNVLTNYDSALRLVKTRAESTPPALVIDLELGQVTIDGVPLPLSAAERLWYAYLAYRRPETTDGWVTAGQDGHASFYDFLTRADAKRWAASIRTKPLLDLLEGAYVLDEDLRNLRGKTVQRVKRWCAANRPELGPLLIPAADGSGRQRLAIPAHRILVRGLM